MSAAANQRGERDLRLDFFRGLALITIFINHVPGTIFELATTRNFGFSDAAEAFVLMSGISAGLAYTNAYLRDQFQTRLIILRRAARLYSVHLMSTIVAVCVLLIGHFFFDTDPLSRRINLYPVLHEHAEWILGFITLGHQLGYFNILPLYIILLGVTPFLLPLALSNPRRLILASVIIWFVAGHFRINLPNFPADGFWFLNPFSWQLIFVIGLDVGVCRKRGLALLGYNPVLMTLAVAYAVCSLAVVQLHLWDNILFPDITQVLAGFDKGILPFPRLLHILSLFYIVINLKACFGLSMAKASEPIVVLGRQSLGVFAWGSVISIALQMLKEAEQFTWQMDLVALSTGLLLQYLIASYLNTQKTTKRASMNAARVEKNLA
jgi:hypothetical protein